MSMEYNDGFRGSSIVDWEPSMTKQAFKDESDINQIISGFAKSGMVDSLNSKEPFYGDVSEIVGYKEALDIVQRADDLFAAMSAEVRQKFFNDPSQMISFLADPANVDEAVKLGLVVKRADVSSEAVTPVGDANVAKS